MEARLELLVKTKEASFLKKKPAFALFLLTRLEVSDRLDIPS
jgi:hypothetical protein